MEISFFDNPDAPVAAQPNVIEPNVTMKIALETVSPWLAQQLLNGNTENRPAKDRHVKFLADQMRAGAWQVTGDPVKISTTGRLLDGQHRLLAIIQSETSQLMYVARDCQEEIFSVLDTGKNRSASDVLATAGQKNHTNMAATAKLLIMHERGNLGNMAGKQRASTNADVLDFVRKHDVDESVTKAHSYSKRCKLLNPGEWAALHYLFARVDADQADAYLSQISTGLNLTEGHPVFMLRGKLQQARDGRFNFSPAERLALTIKAWNAHRAGKKVLQLTWKNHEEFPEIE